MAIGLIDGHERLVVDDEVWYPKVELSCACQTWSRYGYTLPVPRVETHQDVLDRLAGQPVRQDGSLLESESCGLSVTSLPPPSM